MGSEVDVESDFDFALGSNDLEAWRFGDHSSEEITTVRDTPLPQLPQNNHHSQASAPTMTPRTAHNLPRLILPTSEGTNIQMDALVQTPSPAYSSPSRDGYPPLRYSPPIRSRHEPSSSPTSPTRIPLLQPTSSPSQLHGQDATFFTTSLNPFRSFSFLLLEVPDTLPFLHFAGITFWRLTFFWFLPR